MAPKLRQRGQEEYIMSSRLMWFSKQLAHKETTSIQYRPLKNKTRKTKQQGKKPNTKNTEPSCHINKMGKLDKGA